MRSRLALAAFLLLALGGFAYQSFAGREAVQVSEDGTPPPPSFP
jgi:hypothetical protein